ncbi:inositol phosphatase [Poseidonibacter parvus]|uniref:Inositol phosphatase n=1 Tax=Poseidonibacter parvus TaxID=1850254 RepID=A0A1P8KNS1_9BACT|nr:inositol monophosphatase family protein [Poseidonibacter parvus]APW66153.1 inositol phosphatase [Poseidonibacter parvus]
MKTQITDLYKSTFIKAVILANKELLTYINNELKLEDLNYSKQIGYGGDKTLNIDLIAEEIFIRYLEVFGNIYSEECGRLSDDKNFDIIIDPLDGSDNFSSNLPYYGTSIALVSNDKTIAGFVCNLVNGILTYKAFDEEVKYEYLLDNRDNLLITSNKKIGIFERAYAYPNICTKLRQKNIKFRSPGAVALSLCDAKNYDFVLFVGNIREFDILASLYICDDLFLYKTDKFVLIAQNIQKFNQIKEILKE